MDEIKVTATFTGKDELVRKLENHPKAMAKAFQHTCADFATRAPGWVTKAVRMHYTADGKVIRKALKGKEKSSSIRIGGMTVDGIRFKYSGGLLTPTPFGMSPKKPEPKKRTVKAKILKNGPRKVLSPIAYLAHAKSGDADSKYIPFQRRGSSRLPVDVIKTVSVAQMIQNEKVSSGIEKVLETELAKRMEHNMRRAIDSL